MLARRWGVGRVGSGAPMASTKSSFSSEGASKPAIHEVLPKAGLVYSEKGNLSEVLCKPKIMPIKSTSLQKLEELEAQAARATTAMPSTGM